tara:strand:+ start:191 stop:526 length:336 start_codon:yes stop_codon:yes gene_type:complete
MTDKNQRYELEDLVSDACDVFDEESKHYSDLDDAVHETADGFVPIYYWDIAQYAAHNHWLMIEISERCSESNAHDQIQANIYDYIVDGIYEHIEERNEKINEKNRKITKGE